MRRDSRCFGLTFASLCKSRSAGHLVNRFQRPRRDLSTMVHRPCCRRPGLRAWDWHQNFLRIICLPGDRRGGPPMNVFSPSRRKFVRRSARGPRLGAFPRSLARKEARESRPCKLHQDGVQETSGGAFCRCYFQYVLEDVYSSWLIGLGGLVVSPREEES